jgi:hypothetical protein
MDQEPENTEKGITLGTSGQLREPLTKVCEANEFSRIGHYITSSSFAMTQRIPDHVDGRRCVVCLVSSRQLGCFQHLVIFLPPPPAPQLVLSFLNPRHLLLY